MANGRALNDPQTSVEVSAKSVDEAVAKALRQLDCSREDVEVEVLHPGSPGRLLGFGAEPARVRVILAAAAAAGVSPAASLTPAGESDLEEGVETDEVDLFNRAESAGVAEAVDEEEGDEEEEERDAFEDAEVARSLLSELLDRMDLQGMEVEVVSNDPITLNVRAEDVADLIGRRGENLRALQFVLNLMVNKQLKRRQRVSIDVDGYRARREELLTGMAGRLAQRVRATGQPMPLEAMPPNERRIIHMALAEDADVMTESVGEGDARRIVIKPRR